MLGHIMRYCGECAGVWGEFKAACEAEGQRLNAILDLWEHEKRATLPLKLTPLDLPRLVVNKKDGSAIILG